MSETHNKPIEEFFIFTLSSERASIILQENIELPPDIIAAKGKCAACAVCLACWFTMAAAMLAAGGAIAK